MQQLNIDCLANWIESIKQSEELRNQVSIQQLQKIKIQMDQLINTYTKEHKIADLEYTLEQLNYFLKQTLLTVQLQVLNTEKNQVNTLEYYMHHVLDKYYGEYQIMQFQINHQDQLEWVETTKMSQKQQQQVLDLVGYYYNQKIVAHNCQVYCFEDQEVAKAREQVGKMFGKQANDVQLLLFRDSKQQRRYDQNLVYFLVIDSQRSSKVYRNYFVMKDKGQNQIPILENLVNFQQDKKQNKFYNLISYAINMFQEIQRDIIQNLDLIVQSMLKWGLQKLYQNKAIEVDLKSSLDTGCSNSIDLDIGVQFVVNQDDIDLSLFRKTIKEYYSRNIKDFNQLLINLKYSSLSKMMYPQQLMMIFDTEMKLFQIIYNDYDCFNSLTKTEQIKDDLSLKVIFRNMSSIVNNMEQIEQLGYQEIKQFQDESTNTNITCQNFYDISNQKTGYQITFQEILVSNFSNNSFITEDLSSQKTNKIQQIFNNISKQKNQHIYLEQFINIEQKIQQKIKQNDSNKKKFRKKNDFFGSLIQKANDTDSSTESQQINQKLIRNKFSEMEYCKYDEWDFNALTLTNNNQSIYCAFYYFQYFGFIENLGIEYKMLMNFLQKLQEKYTQNMNPFHNFHHALTVVQGVVHLIKQNVIQIYYDELDQFSLLLAALCHDTDHPGTNNTYQIATISKITLKYNDTSPLEQHHLYESFKIMMNENSNIFTKFDYESYNQVRKNMIAGILATDMKQHFEIIENFQRQVNASKEEGQPIKLENHQQKNLMTGFIVHTCDFSGSAKKYDVSKQWSERISKEFYNQNILETKNNIPQSPHMVNLKIKQIMAKQEVGFLKFIVLPNWQLANQFFDSKLSVLIQNLEQNINEWKQVVDNEQS